MNGPTNIPDGPFVEAAAAGCVRRDLIVTGLPRGGTTLVAALIDSLTECVCLSEPQRHVDLAARSGSVTDFVAALERDFRALRRTLEAGDSVPDRRAANGGPLDNYFAAPNQAGERPATGITVTRKVPGFSPSWVLGVKHNALFAAVLPEILASGRWTVLAIIREPADAIASWNSLQIPARHGRLPAAEQFWPEIAALGARHDLPLLDRQILLADRVLDRFRIPGVYVLRYEDLIHDIFCLERVPVLAGRKRRTGDLGVRAVAPRQDAVVIRARIAEMSAAGLLSGIDAFYPARC